MSDTPNRPWRNDGPDAEAPGEGLEVGGPTQPLTRPEPRRPGAGDTAQLPVAEEDAEEPGAADVMSLREDPERTTGWGKALATLALAATVLGGLYVGLAYWAGTHVPQNTHVRGIDIGGATKEDAEATLRSRLAQTTAAPVKISHDDQEAAIDPAPAGLTVDYDATLDGVTGVSFAPAVVWERLTGNGHDRPLRVTADTARLEAALAERGAGWKTAPQEGTVTFTNGTVNSTPAQQGTELDVAATAAAVQQAWPTARPVPASMRAIDPQIPQSEVERFVRDTGNVVVSGPVTLKVGEKDATLDPARITQATTVERKDGKLSLVVDKAKLLALVRAAAPQGETPATNATITLADGKPRTTPEKPGRGIDPDGLVREFTAAVTRTGQRSATVPMTESKPTLTEAQLKGMDLKEPMSEFRSRFPGGTENEGRTHNIGVGLRHVNGTVVKPGEQFSLLKKLGAMDETQGYVNAGVIINGMPAEAMAGGLSQVSTVVYNASYFAGVQLDEHTAHSYYISRYPAGREATIWGGQIDNKWTNDTTAPIYIEAFIEGSEVVMRFWGKKVYDVKSVSSDRFAITQPKHRDNPAANCEADHGTEEGFSITVTRILSKDGTEVKRQPVTTTYIPADEVTCTNPDAPGFGH